MVNTNNSLHLTRKMAIEEAWKKVLNEVSIATEDPGHPFRNLTLATVDNEGVPHQRTVILRDFMKSSEFLIYTDSRSAKVKQISQNNSVSLLFYDDQKKLQLQVNGVASVITNGHLHEEHWNNHGRKRARSFTSVLKPGTILENPEDAYEWNPEDSSCFCIIQIRAREMEFLQLDGHRHLRGFKWLEDEVQQHSWIAP